MRTIVVLFSLSVPLWIPVWAFPAAPLARADTWLVDDDGPGDFTEIQPAVTAAVDGDIVLVSPGIYSGFHVHDKDLRVLGGPDVSVQGALVVSGLASSRTVVIADLDVNAAQSDEPALLVSACEGPVRIVRCSLLGDDSDWSDDGSCYCLGGQPGATIVASRDVYFVETVVEGGYGSGSEREGIDLTDSRLALYDCQVVGGEGEGSPYIHFGGDGGVGIHPVGPLATARCVGAGTLFRGGDGGDAYDWGGDGGHGFVKGSMGSDVLDCTFVGGTGGLGGLSYGSDGGAVVDDGGGMPFNVYPGTLRRLHMPRFVVGGAAFPVTVHGEPGDVVELHWSERTEWKQVPSKYGVWLPETPPSEAKLLGVVPASGVLVTETSVTVPGGDYADVFAQLHVTSIGGTAWLGGAHYALASAGPQRYCVAAPNSVGPGAPIEASGSFRIGTADVLTLSATGAPPNQFGLFLYGFVPQQMPRADGFLCVRGSIYRILPAVQSDSAGTFLTVVDPLLPPFGAGPGLVLPGDAPSFQLWYRDSMGPGGTGSNFSDAVTVPFLP